MHHQGPYLGGFRQTLGDALPVVVAVGLPVQTAAAQGPFFPVARNQRPLAGDAYINMGSGAFRLSCFPSRIISPSRWWLHFTTLWIVLLIARLVKGVQGNRTGLSH